MLIPRTALALIVTAAAIVPAAIGQQIGNAERGMQYASEVCSACHAVRSGEMRSPISDAPPFEEIANTSGMTFTALTVWFQSSHPTMPNINMTDEEMRDVIQYILSLKSN